jgi:CRP-like cAMP-binding protein
VIAKAVRPVRHAAGAVVATEGEPGAGLFVIDQGEADVTIGGKKLNHLGPGDFFGEMALLDGGPRTATVTATTELSLFALTEWVYRGLLTEHPSIALRTLEAMAARLRRATKALIS